MWGVKFYLFIPEEWHAVLNKEEMVEEWNRFYVI